MKNLLATYILCLSTLFVIQLRYNSLNAQTNTAIDFKNITLAALGNETSSLYTGANWIDYNNDGYLDLFITNDGGKFELYKNKKDGTFEKVTTAKITEGSKGSSPVWGDFNNDGNPDLFVAVQGNAGNLFYYNNGNGIFSPIKTSAPAIAKGDSYQGAWTDYDNDGYLDLFVANFDSGQQNFLSHNNGDENFTQVTEGDIVNDKFQNSCGNWSDYDNDGDQDLYVASWGTPSQFYENNGDGTFTKKTNLAIVKETAVSISCSWVDYNNDGYMDLFVSNGWPAKSKNFLFKNNGDKSFTKITEGEIVNDLVNSWSASWGDLNNDGYIDLFVVDYTHQNIIYMNNGDGTFTKPAGLNILIGNKNTSAGVIGDYDNDGNLDIFLPNVPGKKELWQNITNNKNHWIEIKCLGTESNASAIGARVMVKTTISGKSSWQTREVSSLLGMRGSNLVVHFGLGDAITVDTLLVNWPSGQKTIMKDVKPDQILTIKEDVRNGFIRANFKADTITGYDSLLVNFSDLSIFNPNEPIISWKWDFNSDGTIDSEEQGPSYNFKTKYKPTSFTVSLTVDNGKERKTIKKENYITLKLQMPKEYVNLALNKTAYASSIENANYLERFAIDGSLNSRWASLFTDPQWYMVDLGKVDTIGAIILRWETASALEYSIEVSVDSVEWTKIYVTKNCPGGNDDIVFEKTRARYVKLNGISRSTAYGYSLYEIEIYGLGKLISTMNKLYESNNMLSCFPNPFYNIINLTYNLHQGSRVCLKIYDQTGRQIDEILNGYQDAGHYNVTWNGRFRGNIIASPGVYICRLEILNSKGYYYENFKIIKQ